MVRQLYLSSAASLLDEPQLSELVVLQPAGHSVWIGIHQSEGAHNVPEWWTGNPVRTRANPTVWELLPRDEHYCSGERLVATPSPQCGRLTLEHLLVLRIVKGEAPEGQAELTLTCGMCDGPAGENG